MRLRRLEYIPTSEQQQDLPIPQLRRLQQPAIAEAGEQPQQQMISPSSFQEKIAAQQAETPGDETTTGAVVRNIARPLIKYGIAAGRAPIGIVDLPVTLGNAAYKALTGKQSQIPADIVSHTAFGLPSQEELEFIASKGLPKGYLKSPESGILGKIDQIAESAGSFKGLGSTALGALAKGAAGESARTFVKQLPKNRLEDVLELGAFAVGSQAPNLFGKGFTGAVKAAKADWYKNADEALRESKYKINPMGTLRRSEMLRKSVNETVSKAKNPETSKLLNDVIDTVEKKVGEFSKVKEARKPIEGAPKYGPRGERVFEEVEKVSKQEKIPAQTYWDLKKYINNEIEKIESGETKIPDSEKGYAMRRLNQISKMVSEPLLGEVSQAVPEFGENFKKAEGMHRGQELANEAADFVTSDTKAAEVAKVPWLKTALFGLGGTGLISGLLAKYGLIKTAGAAGLAGAAVGAAKGLTEAARLQTLIRTNPNAAKIYKHLVTSAIKHDGPGVMAATRSLNKIAEKDEKRYPSLKRTIRIV